MGLRKKKIVIARDVKFNTTTWEKPQERIHNRIDPLEEEAEEETRTLDEESPDEEIEDEDREEKFYR